MAKCAAQLGLTYSVILCERNAGHSGDHEAAVPNGHVVWHDEECRERIRIDSVYYYCKNQKGHEDRDCTPHYTTVSCPDEAHEPYSINWGRYA